MWSKPTTRSWTRISSARPAGRANMQGRPAPVSKGRSQTAPNLLFSPKPGTSMYRTATALLAGLTVAACSPAEKQPASAAMTTSDSLLAQYDTVRLTTDLTQLSDSERQMLPLLIAAAQELSLIHISEPTRLLSSSYAVF